MSKDDRLPDNFSVFLNYWNEYVVCDGDKVAQIKGKNVRMAKTKEEAVQNYLNKITA